MGGDMHGRELTGSHLEAIVASYGWTYDLSGTNHRAAILYGAKLAANRYG